MEKKTTKPTKIWISWAWMGLDMKPTKTVIWGWVLGMCMRPKPNSRLSFFGCECTNRPEPVKSKFSFLRRDVTVTDRSIVVPFPRRFPPTLFLFLNILLHFSALTRTRILCMKWQQRSLNLMFFGLKRCGNGNGSGAAVVLM